MHDPHDQTEVDQTEVGGDPRAPYLDDSARENLLLEAGRAIEAIVLLATDPIEEHVLAQLLELPVAAVHTLCVQLSEGYRAQRRGFELAQVAGGWRYQTHADLAPYIERYVLDGQTARLSSAALETLAIVAYKQPISRAQMSAIRGVNVDGVLRTLLQRGYVTEVGQDTGPGQAILFGTTLDFLERLGLASLDDLPPLGDFVPSAAVVEALEQTLRADVSVRAPEMIDLTDAAASTADTSGPLS